MKKKVILPLLILVIIALVFIPFNQEKTIVIKLPFLSTYSLLTNAGKWEKWRPDLRKALFSDSSNISVKKDTNSFLIKYKAVELGINFIGNVFNINEKVNGKTQNYSYTLTPVSDKFLNKTTIEASQKVNAVAYLIGMFKKDSFSDTHINDLKNFIETDSLYYGCKIFKTRVPDTNLIVMRKAVLKKDRFTGAATMFSAMQQYIKANDIRKTQPVIAQFLPKGNDSTQVNVGFFVDKYGKPDNEISFVKMPKGGPFYASKFQGRFSKRQIVYIGLQQYYADHGYQTAILPFETYLDNKLPATDTDKINIQVNFSAYF